MDATHAAAVGATGFTAADDTEAAEVARGAAGDVAGTAANYYDGATTSVWLADPV